MGSVGDELLVARQADDGGAGELLRWDRAAGGRRGVGQVPRRHGLEEPLGRGRACGRAGRRRRRPAGSSRHARSAARTRDARTRKEQKDTASEPGSAATTSTRRSDRSAARLLRGRVAVASRRRRDFGRGRETARETKTGRPLAAPSPPAGSTPGPRVSRRPARSSAGSRRPTPHRWRCSPSWAASSWTRPCVR